MYIIMKVIESGMHIPYCMTAEEIPMASELIFSGWPLSKAEK